MASAYLNTSLVFRNLNIVNVVSYNVATALWGANLSNTVLAIFSLEHSLYQKILIAWLCGITTISQALTTVELKKDYVQWGFIDVDLVGALENLKNLISLTSAIATISCQAFLAYQIWLHAQQPLFTLLLATLPLILQLLCPLGSLIAPPDSAWQLNYKEALLATLVLKMLINTVLCATLSVIWWRVYFSASSSLTRKSHLQSILNVINFTINMNMWVVAVGLSELVMFYFLYSYSSLFLLYSHVLTPLYVMTVLSILDELRSRTKSPALSQNGNNDSNDKSLIRWSVAPRSGMSDDSASRANDTATESLRVYHSTNGRSTT